MAAVHPARLVRPVLPARRVPPVLPAHRLPVLHPHPALHRRQVPLPHPVAVVVLLATRLVQVLPVFLDPRLLVGQRQEVEPVRLHQRALVMILNARS